jgi:probable addiction module antidote protein
MTVKTIPFDAALHLQSRKAQAELLRDALESGDAGFIATALGIIARAQGMAHVAAEAGVTREALYKSLSASGDPRLTTLLGVTKALGIEMTMKLGKPATAKPARKARKAA